MSEPSFEQAREELAGIVRQLEAGGLTLEESLALWERGESLAATCRGWLEQARARLDGDAGGDADGDADGDAAGRAEQDASG